MTKAEATKRSKDKRDRAKKTRTLIHNIQFAEIAKKIDKVMSDMVDFISKDNSSLEYTNYIDQVKAFHFDLSSSGIQKYVVKTKKQVSVQ